MNPSRILISWLAASLILFGSCLSDCRADDYEDLLDKDWQTMSDEDLAGYDAELTEAIKDCEDYTGKQMVGKGTKTGGEFGKDIGFSFGTQPGTKACDSKDLRERQAEVRAAMRLRGVTPDSSG